MGFGSWFDAGVDFFGGGEGGWAAAGNLINIGTGLYDAFRDHDSESANAMQSMIGASVNPNDPRFKNLVALFEEANRAKAIQNIQNIMTQDARSRARGGSGMIVNPERRDEFRANSLNQAFMDAGQKARMEAAGALRGAAGQYQPLIPYEQQQDALTSNNIGAIGGGIADLFRNYGGSQSMQDIAFNDVNSPDYSDIF